MIPAYAYLRVSGKSQLDGDGFERQRVAIEAYTAAAGIEIVREYEERAVTGKAEWEDRPAWMDMMLSLDGIRTVVIEKLERLARELLVQEHIIADLKKRGITLLSTAEPDLGSDEPSRVFVRQILGAVAQYDRACIVLKLRGARLRMKAKEGRCEGRKPFGWLEEERPALLMMRAMRKEGKLFRVITEELNTAGYRTKSGGMWIEGTVAAILRREARERAARGEADEAA
jgi:DNA invertase Pin-like site-specific DNA recombinase